jgi:stage III sporulation protein AH
MCIKNTYKNNKMRIEYIKFLNKKNKNIKAKHYFDNNFDKKVNSRKIILNKNRVVLVAVSLMLVTASYWNYLNKSKLKIAQFGDATFVNSNVVESENMESKETIANVVENTITNKEQNQITNTNLEANSNYFTKLRMDREKMFSQMIDNYKSIMEDSNIGDEQKKEASNEIKNINKNQNSITTIENLLKGKGFEDAVVLMNDNSTNVIMKSDNELKKEQVAQIENIVSRELSIEIEKIHISMHK